MAYFERNYNDPTDPICAASRVTKIWRARDEVDHKNAQMDKALCVQESLQRNAVEMAKELATNIEINGIVAEAAILRSEKMLALDPEGHAGKCAAAALRVQELAS